MSLPSSRISKNVTCVQVAPGLYVAKEAYSGKPNFFRLSPLLNKESEKKKSK
jgi:hypothetical protein